MNLPKVIPTTIFSLVAGAGISAVGYYTPFFITSSFFNAVGAGLLSTFRTNTGHAKWIAYQVIYGIGPGFSAQTPMVCVQTVLPLKDMPIGSGLMMFMQTLGG